LNMACLVSVSGVACLVSESMFTTLFEWNEIVSGKLLFLPKISKTWTVLKVLA
jgi:hypothetical protein